MRSTGLSRRFAVDGRWYEDRDLGRRQTIADRNNERLNLQRSTGEKRVESSSNFTVNLLKNHCVILLTRVICV